jgi:hypoxanthine phosphoribosyltransferase
MHQICEIIQQKQIKSLSVVTFLHKPDAMVVSARVDYVAFVIENEFVVGYGLDYDGLGRQLPALYQLVNS